MIQINRKEITEIYLGSIPISEVYVGNKLVWMAVRSCFGSGVWIEQKPWLDNEKWKDNKQS